LAEENPLISEERLLPPTLLDPKSEVPRLEDPKSEVPKFEVPKFEVSKLLDPKSEVPTLLDPKLEVPKLEDPKSEVPKFEDPKSVVPRLEDPKLVVPKLLDPKSEVPKVEEGVVVSKVLPPMFLSKEVPEGANVEYEVGVSYTEVSPTTPRGELQSEIPVRVLSRSEVPKFVPLKGRLSKVSLNVEEVGAPARVLSIPLPKAPRPYVEVGGMEVSKADVPKVEGVVVSKAEVPA
jgi:hypothetical protein